MLSIEDQKALERLERAYLEPPDESDFNYDDWFGEMSDLAYENMKEDLFHV